MHRALLIFPPASDARFFPYLSVPQLSAHLQARGVAVDKLDLNIELCHHLAQRAHVDAYAQRAAAAASAGTDEASAWRAGEVLACASELDAAWVCLYRDRERVLNDATFRAFRVLRKVADAQLAELGHTRELASFRQARARIEHAEQHPDLVTDFIGRRLDDQLARATPDLVGVTIAFPSQLVLGLFAVRALRKALPRAKILIGGPAIALHHAALLATEHLLDGVDALAIGAGEAAFDAVCAGDTARVLPGYADLRTLPLPDFEQLPIHSYLSTEFHLGITSCFGCWWGRCSFCSYGNRSLREQSPYREKAPAQLAQQMEQLIERYAPRQINITDENSNLSTLHVATRALQERGNRVSWNARCRLERRLCSRQLCGELAAQGCNILFMGFESTSQRLLDLASRGIQVGDFDQILENLNEAGITPRLSLMLGLPGETRADAEATCAYVIDHLHEVELDAVQHMIAEPFAQIGEQPERFGLTLASDGSLSSNPDTTYGGGRHGRLQLAAPQVDDLLRTVADAKVELDGKRRRQRRLAHFERAVSERPLIASFAPCVGWLPQSRTRTLADFLSGASVEIPNELVPWLEAIERAAQPIDAHALPIAKQLYGDGFLDLGIGAPPWSK